MANHPRAASRPPGPSGRLVQPVLGGAPQDVDPSRVRPGGATSTWRPKSADNWSSCDSCGMPAYGGHCLHCHWLLDQVLARTGGTLV